jgi:hypothetical protein
MSCRIVHVNQLSGRFEVKTGVRQDCLLSPSSSSWSLTGSRSPLQQAGITVCSGDSGHSWMTSTLQTTWHSCRTTTPRYRTMTHLETTSTGTGLKINRKKRPNRWRSTPLSTQPIIVGREPIRKVESFVYLGSVVDHRGYALLDTKHL